MTSQARPKRAHRAPKLDLDITPEIIDRSVPRDSSHCMIADALKAAIPSATFISVDLATIRFTDPAAGMRYIYLTPRAGQLALLAFDAGEKPEPFRMRSIRAAQMVRSGRKSSGLGSPAVQKASAPRGVGTKVGGQAPPKGPLRATKDGNPARKAKSEAAKRDAVRTGKRREFGIRAIVK